MRKGGTELSVAPRSAPGGAPRGFKYVLLTGRPDGRGRATIGAPARHAACRRRDDDDDHDDDLDDDDDDDDVDVDDDDDDDDDDDSSRGDDDDDDERRSHGASTRATMASTTANDDEREGYHKIRWGRWIRNVPSQEASYPGGFFV